MGEARLNFNRMVRGMSSMKEISENVLGDQLNIEGYVKELTDVCKEMFMGSCSMFEQERLRFINLFAATGGTRRRRPVPKGHHGPQGVIQDLIAVNGGKSLFR